MGPCAIGICLFIWLQKLLRARCDWQLENVSCCVLSVRQSFFILTAKNWSVMLANPAKCSLTVLKMIYNIRPHDFDTGLDKRDILIMANKTMIKVRQLRHWCHLVQHTGHMAEGWWKEQSNTSNHERVWMKNRFLMGCSVSNHSCNVDI